MTGCGCDGAKCRLAAGDARHGSGLAYRTYGCRCDACGRAGRADSARWRAKNRQRVKERNAQYRTTCAEKVREIKAQYRSANVEKIREYRDRYRVVNAAQERDRHARWLQTPEGRAANQRAARRRRERERYRYCGCDTPANLAAVWTLDSGRCAYCNAPGTDYEHVIPLARGGWGCVSNFRIACKSCNSRKGTKPLSVFLAALAASGTPVRPGATNSGLPCPAAAARMAVRMLPASPGSPD